MYECYVDTAEYGRLEQHSVQWIWRNFHIHNVQHAQPAEWMRCFWHSTFRRPFNILYIYKYCVSLFNVCYAHVDVCMCTFLVVLQFIYTNKSEMCPCTKSKNYSTKSHAEIFITNTESGVKKTRDVLLYCCWSFNECRKCWCQQHERYKKTTSEIFVISFPTIGRECVYIEKWASNDFVFLLYAAFFLMSFMSFMSQRFRKIYISIFLPGVFHSDFL